MSWKKWPATGPPVDSMDRLSEPAASAATRVVLSADGLAEVFAVAASLDAGAVGSGMGEGVSADACPAIMITTMSDAAIARLLLVEARQRENRRRLTRTPKMIPERVLCPEQAHHHRLRARSSGIVAMNLPSGEKVALTDESASGYRYISDRKLQTFDTPS